MRSAAIVFLFALIVSANGSTLGQDQDDGKNYVLKLDESIVQILRKGEHVESRVPDHVQSTVDKIIISNGDVAYTNPDTYVPDRVVDIRDQVATVVLESGDLNLLQQSRLVLRTDTRDFSRVRISLRDSQSTETEQKTPTLFVVSGNATQTSGQLESPEKITIETSYGELQVNVADVLALRRKGVGAAGNTEGMSLIIAMKNGDLLSGQIGEGWSGSFQLKTQWGTAVVDVKQVDQISVSPDMRMMRRNDEYGVQWTLTRSGVRQTNSFTTPSLPEPTSAFPSQSPINPLNSPGFNPNLPEPTSNGKLIPPSIPGR